MGGFKIKFATETLGMKTSELNRSAARGRYLLLFAIKSIAPYCAIAAFLPIESRAQEARPFDIRVGHQMEFHACLAEGENTLLIVQPKNDGNTASVCVEGISVSQ